VSVSLTNLGDLAQAAGDVPRARQLCERSLTIRDALAAVEPGNTGYQRDVLVSLVRLGHMAREVGDSPRARQLYDWSLAIADALAAVEPGNTGYQSATWVPLTNLGDMARAAGNGPRAHQLLERSLTIAEALAAAEPANTVFQSVTCRSLCGDFSPLQVRLTSNSANKKQSREPRPISGRENEGVLLVPIHDGETLMI
jgi:hypothetical protein